MIFDIRKIAEAVSMIISNSESSISIQKIMLLLYMANREALVKWDDIIINDTILNTVNGPSFLNLSKVIEGIHENKKNQDYWDKYFLTESDKITITAPHPEEYLSAREFRVLKRISKLFINTKDLIKYVKNYPEFKSTNKEIQIADILMEIGRSKKEIKIIEKERLYYLLYNPPIS